MWRRDRAAGYSAAALPSAVILAILLLADAPVTALAPRTSPADADGNADANANAVPDAGSATPPVLRRRPLAVAAALVPGLLLHGSGHFVGGDRRTAGRLLAAEGVGLAAVVAGLGGLAVTGAARRLVTPLVLLTNVGAGLFLSSAAADLYGTLRPPGPPGQPAPLPTVEASAGALFVHNPVLQPRWLASAGADLWLWRWRLSPVVHSAADADTVRAELRAAYRLWGPRPDAPSPRGDFLELGAGVVHHRDSQDITPFDITTGELTLSGRHELQTFAPTLAGAFLDFSAGMAYGTTHFGGRADTFEPTDLLLARFGFGFWLGRGPAPQAEVSLDYDNRHDDFAGGLKLTGLGSGPAGHFGVRARFYPHPRWGVGALAQAGSAHVLGLQLLYRPAEAPR